MFTIEGGRQVTVATVYRVVDAHEHDRSGTNPACLRPSPSGVARTRWTRCRCLAADATHELYGEHPAVEFTEIASEVRLMRIRGRTRPTSAPRDCLQHCRSSTAGAQPAQPFPTSLRRSMQRDLQRAQGVDEIGGLRWSVSASEVASGMTGAAISFRRAPKHRSDNRHMKASMGLPPVGAGTSRSDVPVVSAVRR